MEARAEQGREFAVRRCQWEAGQHLDGSPTQFRVFQGSCGAPHLDLDELDEVGRAGVANRGEGAADRRGLEPELFRHLAPGGVEQGFGRFELPAGKLPQPTMALVWRALAHQPTPVMVNHRRKDADGLLLDGGARLMQVGVGFR